MPKIHTSLAALLVVASVAAVPALGADRAAYPHGSDHAPGELVLALDAGEKWETDPPLRMGMSNIRSALETAAVKIHDERAPEAYPQLAAAVEAQVDYMIENCELPLEADMQLHILFERFLEGVDQLRTPAEAEQGAAAVVEALKAYGGHLEHEGWTPLAH